MGAKNLFIILTIILSTKGIAQRTISGYVSDSTTKAPISYATIRVKQIDSTKTRMVFSDSTGYFQLSSLKPSTYIFTISAVGYVDKTETVSVSENSSENSSLKVMMTKLNGVLREVTVRSKAPVITREVDRIAYNISADPESVTQSVAEVLRKVPLVTVGPSGTLLIRGQTGVKVYIDGRRSSLTLNNPIEILNTMPASNIQRIEVITTPPSSFDGEGVSGIINIVTIKKTAESYSGRVSARYAFPAGGPSANGTLSIVKKKFGASLFSSVSSAKAPSTISNFQRYSANGLPQTLQAGLSQSKSKLYNAQLQLGYQIDSINLLSATVGVSGYLADFTNDRTASLYNESTVLAQSYRVDGSVDFNSANLYSGINFEHRFKKDKRRFYTVSYEHIRNTERQTTIDELNKIFNYIDHIDYYQHNNQGRNENTGQLDFVLPFRKVSMETGAKTIFRDNHSDYTYIRDTANTNAFRIDDRFKYLQTVIAFYNSLSFTVRSFKVKTGLRFEATNNRAKAIETGSTFKQNYFHILPSISIQKKLTDKRSFTFGYSNRIWRPDIVQLNPFVNTKDPLSLTRGNPFLKPAISNNIEMFYTYAGKISVDIGGNYFMSKNNIEIVSKYDPATKITTTDYQNISRKRYAGLSLSINYPIVPNLSFSSNAYYSYFWINGSQQAKTYRQTGNTYSLYASLTKTFKKDFVLAVSGNYNNGILLLQGRTGAFGAYTMSLTKAFLNKKLNTSLALNNFLDKYRFVRNRYIIDNSVQTILLQRYYRQISLSVNYRFGKLRSQVKQNTRKIQNDDIRN